MSQGVTDAPPGAQRRWRALGVVVAVGAFAMFGLYFLGISRSDNTIGTETGPPLGAGVRRQRAPNLVATARADRRSLRRPQHAEVDSGEIAPTMGSDVGDSAATEEPMNLDLLHPCVLQARTVIVKDGIERLIEEEPKDSDRLASMMVALDTLDEQLTRMKQMQQRDASCGTIVATSEGATVRIHGRDWLVTASEVHAMIHAFE